MTWGIARMLAGIHASMRWLIVRCNLDADDPLIQMLFLINCAIVVWALLAAARHWGLI
jgi:hypothetical protein